MGIEAVFIDLQQAYCDIGAVVCNTFVAGGNVRQRKSKLYGTFSLPQSADMTSLDLHIQSVDHLFQRLYRLCKLQIIVLKYRYRTVHDILNRRRKYLQFFFCFGRKMQILFRHFLCISYEVDRMVTDPLKITDTMQQRGQCMAVSRRKIPAA